MKKFCSFYLPLLLWEIFFVLVLLAVIWLAGFHDFLLLVYVGLLFLVGNLLLAGSYYWRQRKLWRFFQQEVPLYDLTQTSDFLTQTTVTALTSELAKKDQASQQLKDQQQQYRDFMNIWVHQMKTPVTVIDLLAQDTPIAPQSLLEENQRLKDGLNLALNLVRATDFQQDFVLKAVPLKALLQKVISQHKTSFIHRQIFPKIEVDAGLVVTSDEKWLFFIMEQIINNSLKYSPAGSTLELTSCVKDQQLQLQMVDHGCGIPARDLPRVTQAFYTGANGRQFAQATGMGLYLVAQLCQRLDLKLAITSTVGKGTTVTLTFPTFQLT